VRGSLTEPGPSNRAAHRTWGRSEWTTIVLGGVGLLDSLYLAWLKLTDRTASCAGIGDCASVNSSRYAQVAGIPIALIGALGYMAVLILLLTERRWPDASWTLRLGVFGIALAGTLYSVYLTYVEIAVLRAVCPFCVVSALCMVVILIISVMRLRAADADA
jgi:uncharacterized membrane protein